MLTDEQIRDLATDLILSHARDVEYLTIHERLADVPEMESATEDEFDAVARRVDRLIGTATVTALLKE